MPQTGRSGCPINLTLEQLGDRWSLIVIRDVMFGNRRTYGDLLAQSEEGIASNILADRLKRLTVSGLLTRRADPAHRQKGIYSLTESSIQLVPLLAQMGAWGRRHTRPSKELSVRAELLEKGARFLAATPMRMGEAMIGAVAVLGIEVREFDDSLQREFEAIVADVVSGLETDAIARSAPSPNHAPEGVN